MQRKIIALSVILSLLLVSCNLPSGDQAPPSSDQSSQPSADAVGTSVALTLTAMNPAPAASPVPAATDTPVPSPTNTLPPTACSPMVTANTDANVRSGPSTDYEIVGALLTGATAIVAGRNDANTWWYIQFPAGAGGHAWIAGSVVTAACVSALLPVIAAPLLPTAPPTLTGTPPTASVDLVAAGMMVHPDPATRGVPVSVRVRVTNQGTGASGPFSVQWWATWAVVGCNWSVASLGPGQSINLDCTYTYAGTSTYTIKMVVDSGNLVDEADETNNTRETTLVVRRP